MANRLLYARIDPLKFEAAIQAESAPFALAQKLFACKDCCRLRPSYKFRDNREDYVTDIDGYNHYYDSRERNDTRPFCIDCGFKNRRLCFRLGNTFDIDVRFSEAQVFCDSCGEFPEPSERKMDGFCKECWDWVLECPEEIVQVESKHCPMRRAMLAEMQKGSGGISHSIRCENVRCRQPFLKCHHVAGNEQLLARR